MKEATHCRRFGGQAIRSSHDEDRLRCVLVAFPKLPGWIPFLSAESSISFRTEYWFCPAGRVLCGTFVPRADGFFVLVKPLFYLPQEGEGKQTEPDGISRNALYGYDLLELQKILEVGIGVLIRFATKWASLHHVD